VFDHSALSLIGLHYKQEIHIFIFFLADNFQVRLVLTKPNSSR
jgi:hypothetical protein